MTNVKLDRLVLADLHCCIIIIPTPDLHHPGYPHFHKYPKGYMFSQENADFM